MSGEPVFENYQNDFHILIDFVIFETEGTHLIYDLININKFQTPNCELQTSN